MKKEELLYNILFPDDDNPNYINYGYFIGSSKRSIFKLKANINESQLNPILICDGNKENAVYAKVFESEVDGFLKIIKDLNFEQIKVNRRYMDKVKYMFRQEIMFHKKKEYKTSLYQYPKRFNKEIKSWEIPNAVH